MVDQLTLPKIELIIDDGLAFNMKIFAIKDKNYMDNCEK